VTGTIAGTAGEIDANKERDWLVGVGCEFETGRVAVDKFEDESESYQVDYLLDILQV
jgi:hypothetical protein